MEKGWTMGGGGAGRVWATYEAKPGNLGLCWNKKISCREQNPLVESEGSGRAAGEAAPWCQRGFGWGRGGGDATAAGTRLSWLRGSRCAPSAQRCPRAGQSRSRHIPRELLLGPPRAAASAGEGQEGGGRSGTVPGRGSALRGLSVAALGGPGHTHRTPSASLGRKQEQQIPSPGCSRGPQAAQLLGDSSVQGLLLALPTGCGTRRDKHRDKLGDTRGGPVLAQLPRAGPSGNKRIPGVPSSCRAPEDPAVPLSLSGGAPLQPWQGIYG